MTAHPVQEKSKAQVDYRKIIFALVVLLGLSSCSRIYGLDEHIVAWLDLAFRLVFAVILAAIVWEVYRWLLAHLVEWFDETVDDGRQSDIYPLFSTLGGVIIIVVLTIYILTALGVESTAAAITGGIIGLAVSFGAQSTIAQFFSGLSLLINRPFKVGDVVELNSDGKRLTVVKIGVMSTTFREWEFDHTYSIPNNVVASATVANVTAKKSSYIMAIFLDFPYNFDFKKVKQVIAATVVQNAHVLTDGDNAPLVEVDGLATSLVTLKVTLHIDSYADHDGIVSDVRQSLVDAFLANDIAMSRHASQDVYLFDGRSQ